MVTSVPASTSNAAFAGVPQSVQVPTPFTSGPSTIAQPGRLDPNALNGLTLMNGMTAGYGVNDGHVDNPPAYPGTYGGNPVWAPKRIGVMRNVPGTLAQNYSLYFIFNPNEVDVGFQTAQGQIPPSYLYAGAPGNTSATDTLGVAPVSAPNFANAQSVSWTLLFDRTYDMMYGDPGGGDPNVNRGVLRDTAALYNIMGTFETTGATPISTPVQVAFAQTNSGQLWGFTGFVTSVQIQYGQFRWDMIPSRCSVQLQMTCVYVPAQTPGSDTSLNGGGPGTSGAANLGPGATPASVAAAAVAGIPGATNAGSAVTSAPASTVPAGQIGSTFGAGSLGLGG